MTTRADADLELRRRLRRRWCLDEIPGLPPTRALPPGLLEQTTPGWVLTIYRSEPAGVEEATGVDSLPPAVAHTVVLVSPSGERYRVADLPHDMGVSLLRWTAGSSTAVVTVDWSGDLGKGSSTAAVLDLVTGEITWTELPFDALDAYTPQYIGEAADGAELWADGASTDATVSQVYRVTDDGAQELGLVGDEWLLDPSRRWLAADANIDLDTNTVHLIDVIGGEHVEHDFGVAGQRCDVVGWLDPGQLLAFCVDDSLAVGEPVDPVTAHASWYRIDVSLSAATATLLARLGPSDPHPFRTWDGGWAASGVVAFSGATGDIGDPYQCAEDAYLWTGTAAVPTGSRRERRSTPSARTRCWSRPARAAAATRPRRRCARSTSPRGPRQCWPQSRRPPQTSHGG